MVKREAKIINALGLHARATSLVVGTAERFESEIILRFRGATANARYPMEILLLAAPVGAVVQILVEGPDEEAAADALVSLIEGRFGEPD